MITSNSSITVFVDPALLAEHLDEIVARLDNFNFPFLSADLERGELVLDSSDDHEEYSAFMIVSLVFRELDLDASSLSL